MRQLIVNADDFALTEKVSRGILDAHRLGIVTSTTLMANGAAFDAAVALSRRAPRLGVGVHLNLTQGVPTSPAGKIPTLTNLEGNLYLTPSRLLLGILTRRVDLAEIEIELRAQVEKVCQAGILPTHFDGHKHVHIFPGISDVVIALAGQYSVRCVRCPREDAPGLPELWRRTASRPAVAKQYVAGRAVSSFASRFWKKLSRAGLLSPAHFYGLTPTGFLDSPVLRAILANLPEGCSELMCHPGYLDLELAKTGTRLLEQREVEVRALTAPEVRMLVAKGGIQLVSYGNLSLPLPSDARAWRTATPILMDPAQPASARRLRDE